MARTTRSVSGRQPLSDEVYLAPDPSDDGSVSNIQNVRGISSQQSLSPDKSANAGWQDFADSATQATPLQVTDINGGELQLTCDNEGVLTDGNTNDNQTTTMDNVNDIWNTTSNTIQFKGTGLKANQNIFARIHMELSPNIIPSKFDVRLDFYSEENAGGNLVFSLKKSIDEITATAGLFEEYIEEFRFFVGESIINGSATINIVGSQPFLAKVVGFNFLIISNDL